MSDDDLTDTEQPIPLERIDVDHEPAPVAATGRCRWPYLERPVTSRPRRQSSRSRRGIPARPAPAPTDPEELT